MRARVLKQLVGVCLCARACARGFACAALSSVCVRARVSLITVAARARDETMCGRVFVYTRMRQGIRVYPQSLLG